MPPAPRGVEASRQVARDHQPTLVVRCPIANPVPGSEPGKGDGVACLSGGVHEALRNPPIGIAVTPSLPSQKYEHASQKSHVVLGLGIRAPAVESVLALRHPVISVTMAAMSEMQKAMLPAAVGTCGVVYRSAALLLRSSS